MFAGLHNVHAITFDDEINNGSLDTLHVLHSKAKPVGSRWKPISIDQLYVDIFRIKE